MTKATFLLMFSKVFQHWSMYFFPSAACKSFVQFPSNVLAYQLKRFVTKCHCIYRDVRDRGRRETGQKDKQWAPDFDNNLLYDT